VEVTGTTAIPHTVDDWKSIQKQVHANPADYQNSGIGIITAIFGHKYLIQTVDMLIANGGVKDVDLYTTIEQFLSAIDSPAVRRHLVSLCLHSDNPVAVGISSLCLVEQARDAPDLFDYLPAFAKSSKSDVQYCGVACYCELARYMSAVEMRAAADLFRNFDDSGVQIKVKQLDELATSG